MTTDERSRLLFAAAVGGATDDPDDSTSRGLLGDGGRRRRWMPTTNAARIAASLVLTLAVASHANARRATGAPRLGRGRAHGNKHRAPRLGAYADVPVACLEKCRTRSPTLVPALEAVPMDCDVIANTDEQECIFSEPACGLGDTRVLEAIEAHCPSALDPPPAPSLGRAWDVEARLGGAWRLSETPPSESEEKIIAVNAPSYEEWKAETSAKLGKWDVSVAPKQKWSELRKERRFTMYTQCVEDAVANKFPSLFGSSGRISGAYVVKHNLHRNTPSDFFTIEDSVELINGAVNFLKCVSTKLGTVCPTSDGIFETTTTDVNFEWGFAARDSANRVHYEIGGIQAPLFQKKCVDTQQYGPFWNRVMTLERNQEDLSYVFGGCNRTCAPPEFWCPEGTWYLGGTCSVACPPGYGGSGSTPTTRRCVQCPKNCNKCIDGQCTECTNSKYLHQGACVNECPSGFVFGGSRRVVNISPGDFDEFSVSSDASSRYTQPVFENEYPFIYFGHGYRALGTADADDVFYPALEDRDFWTEAWISATIDDRCQFDVYSTLGGKWCTNSNPAGDGGANCCTSYGKWMSTSIVALNASNPAQELTTHSGIQTQVDKTSNYGRYRNGNWISTAASGNIGRYQWRNKTWTSRIRRDGTISTWVDHSLKTQGEPTGPPDFNAPQFYGDLGRFSAFQVQKSGGWAEGGAVMSEIAGAIKSTRRWKTGLYCVAQGGSSASIIVPDT